MLLPGLRAPRRLEFSVSRYRLFIASAMTVGVLAAGCSHGEPSVESTQDLDSRYCAAVREWFAADEIQSLDDPDRHARRVAAARDTFAVLAGEFAQAGRSNVSVEITKATDRMRDYEAALTGPFDPRSDTIFLSVYAALRATRITCPSPIFPT